MEHRDVFLLDNIIEYCEKIEAVLSELDNQKNNFLANPKMQDLCAFYCLQIGETANSLSDNFVYANSEIDWRGIIGLRHIIAHEYGAIDENLLWDILTTEVPKLHKFCVGLIQ